MLLDTGLFPALLQALAAVSTGGFASSPDSIAALEPAARGVVLALCGLGAVPLAVHHHAARGRWGAAISDPQVVGLVVAGTLVTAWLVSHGGFADSSPAARLGHGALTAFSAQTTAGFNTVAPATLPPGSKLVLAGAMLVGGGTGSTAGGVKLLRLLVLLRLFAATLTRTAMPRQARSILRVAGRRLGDDELRDILVLLAGFGSVVALSWWAFVTAGYPAVDAFFDVASATSTTGLSTGVTGPGLATHLKLVLIADMLLGRLEIVALLVLLAPRSWLGRRMETP
ncbi:MAG: potassium transporter TrkG [Gemmatimonadales bacterium]